MTTTGVSPASSGPAGAYFEGQVGASYLLAMLSGAEPRGLPGTRIERVELQRASEGRPLDDVIVHACDAQGKTAVLEVQVKRSITFAPRDNVFKEVVQQIVKAANRPDFRNSRYELAIATAQTSRKIAGPYQDVLTWARNLGSAATFMARIDRPGSASDDMRTFVRTFKSHLHDAGVPCDDDYTWYLLRRLQIHVYDFAATGSADEELAKERAARALHPEDARQAGNLWKALVVLALEIASSGGDRTRASLVEDLNSKSFRLAGERRHGRSRAALAEASGNALEDIGDRVGDVMLSRQERIAEVRTALDEARYVEIRGDAGVGKSGLLKHFAEQTSTEARIIVLSPDRTPSGGWEAMRARLGFDGTARELLTDLACDGGALLCFDNLDFFKIKERLTVIDLVRTAAEVPGVTVIATARRDFGLDELDEPSWLPRDALERLGYADPVIVGELTENEIDELRHADPRLAALLTDQHPARDVVRNLFRLARLAARPAEEPVPGTEIDMAEQWWRSGGVARGEGRRERVRLLTALAEQALSGAGVLDVRDHPPEAVNVLIAGETLRDLGADRVTFRHDVLREWAIGHLLVSRPEAFGCLPLDQPAPPGLARAIELAARFFLERHSDDARWRELLNCVSRADAHGSWRRGVLLAIVRSEAAEELLERTSASLLADRACLLCELIRIVLAIDAQPAKRFFASSGVDPATIPAALNLLYVPTGPTWPHLIRWLLKLDGKLPFAAIPDVVPLYTAWSRGMLGLDPITPKLLAWLHRWLVEIQAARDNEVFSRWEAFGGELDHNKIRALEGNLQADFLLFCSRTPHLAVDYLKFVIRHRRNDDILRSILRFRGSLAQAAPAQLAELTAVALIQQPESEARRYHGLRDEAFTLVDAEFSPASPAQGLFLELLTHAPKHGLSLIRRLIDHAVSSQTGGNVNQSDALIIPFPHGERLFPCVSSYAWSRSKFSRYFSATSALMALEAWAHRRIENGEAFAHVLNDVLGLPAAPAAYLLVAVDLLLSHWPASREVAIPFLACPELLCLDRERQVSDHCPDPDLFGLDALQKEPEGPVSIEQLNSRPSRRHSLEELLGCYAVSPPAEQREALAGLLRKAAERIDQPDDRSDLGDPAFMVVHALNLIDPKNYQHVDFEREDGLRSSGFQYVSPEAEERHLAALRETRRDPSEDAKMLAALHAALENPNRSSSELAEAAVAWAQRAQERPKGEIEGEAQMRDQAVVAAGLIAMRDGDRKLRNKYRDWAQGVFCNAIETDKGTGPLIRRGLSFQPSATAFAGMAYLLKDHVTPAQVRLLFEFAARAKPAVANGFEVTAETLTAIDPRLPRSVLRAALAACVRPVLTWKLPEAQKTTRAEKYQKRIQMALDAEMAWWTGDQAEPEWPVFPTDTVRIPRRPRVSRGLGRTSLAAVPRFQPEQIVNHQAAARWIGAAASKVDDTNRFWLRQLVGTYGEWTAVVNGAGLPPDEELTKTPREWNNVYFWLAGLCVSGLLLAEIDDIAVRRILSLPDEPFLEAATYFLSSVDQIYFEHQGLDDACAVGIRSVLSDRLMTTSAWRRLSGDCSGGIERDLGSAVAAFFFNDYSGFEQPRCYLFEKDSERIGPFIPVLQKLVESAPSLFVAIVLLNLLDVVPRQACLPLMIAASKIWMSAFKDDRRFWIDYDIGRRVCVWIDRIRLQQQEAFAREQPLRGELNRLLASLVRLGIPEAYQLEAVLASPL
jgi:hypothetical protein